MGLANTYSRRLRASQPDGVDVYQYDEVPQDLRTQIFCIVSESFDFLVTHRFDISTLWRDLCGIVAKESGIRKLRAASECDLEQYFYREAKLIGVLDFCDLSFGYIKEKLAVIDSRYCSKQYFEVYKQKVDELNAYFKESSFGYEYNNNQVIRIDSQHIHKEIIKPALRLLGDERFKKVDEEYRLAHEHYRNKHIKDCIVACNRAFESMLKTICDLERWEYTSGARASDLITLVRKNDLFLDGMATNFNSFVAMLKNGVPAFRNDHGGHGEGSDATEQPLYMAQYMLNLTASNLLFLYEAWNKHSTSKCK